MVEETILSSPVVLAIAGGFMHGSIYGGKAYIEGEEFAPIKFALTVVLAGVIGVAFFALGHDPSPADWGLVLLAYTGVVAEGEAILKLLVRGQTQEAHHRLDRARDEARSGTEQVARSATGRRLMDSARGLSPDSGVDVDDQSEPKPEPEPEMVVEPPSAPESVSRATPDYRPLAVDEHAADAWEDSYAAIAAAADDPGNEHLDDRTTDADAYSHPRSPPDVDSKSNSYLDGR
jgi:hypothetical protein